MAGSVAGSFEGGDDRAGAFVAGRAFLGEPRQRLVDSRASYGISLSTMAIGFPLHFDWSWRTLMNKQWEDIVYHLDGGSAEFRKPKFTMWIGYDW